VSEMSTGDQSRRARCSPSRPTSGCSRLRAQSTLETTTINEYERVLGNLVILDGALAVNPTRQPFASTAPRLRAGRWLSTTSPVRTAVEPGQPSTGRGPGATPGPGGTSST
jgi:hypothetical protein